MIARIAILLFGAIPATLLAVPAFYLLAGAVSSLLGGDWSAVLLAAWGLLGVLGTIGLWAACIWRQDGLVAMLVLCGILAVLMLIAEGLWRDPGWFLPRQFGKDAAELVLLISPLLVGILYVRHVLRHRRCIRVYCPGAIQK